MDKVIFMNKLGFRDGVTGAMLPGLGFSRSRTANEELARVLGGIGALPPDFLPNTEQVDALGRAAILEWQP
jgi:hypothetical protein